MTRTRSYGPGRRHGLRPHGSDRTPRNRDPREAGWVLPAAPISRTLTLPVNADEDAVIASYHDGILTISVGLKTEQKASAKKIEVVKGK